MAAEPTFGFLDEINGEKDSWLIRVKVHHVWHLTYKNTPNVVSSLDMLFLDSKGKKIHATVKKNLIPLFEEVLKENSYVEISGFGVGAYTGMYLMVDHPYKIIFYRGTRVKRMAPFEESVDEYTPISFADIIQLRQNPKVAFDIVGQLVVSEDLIIVTENNVTTKQMSIVLQDDSNRRVNCSLWGEHASSIHSYLERNKASAEPIIVFIQLAKMKTWHGNPQVGNSLFGTKIHINADLKPINDFLSRLISGDKVTESTTTTLNLSSNTVVSNPVDFYLDFPLKSLDEALQIDVPMGVVVLARVIKVLVEDGWFYYSCRQCGKKAVERFPIVDDVIEYDCSECHIVTDVERKVRTVVRVQDETGSGSFVLFDKQLTKLLNTTSAWMANKLRGGDPNVLPDEFGSVIDKLFVFKIQISTFNLRNGYVGFTVQKLTDDPEVIRAIEKKKQAHAPDEDNNNNQDDDTPTSKGVVAITDDNSTPPTFPVKLDFSDGKKRKFADFTCDGASASVTCKKAR